MFSGLILNSPFFQQYTDTIDKYKYLIKFFNFFKFFFSVNTRDPNSAQFKKIAA
jgi:alpha-beta hydrolase superfamily lysophospholipase